VPAERARRELPRVRLKREAVQVDLERLGLREEVLARDGADGLRRHRFSPWAGNPPSLATATRRGGGASARAATRSRRGSPSSGRPRSSAPHPGMAGPAKEARAPRREGGGASASRGSPPP